MGMAPGLQGQPRCLAVVVLPQRDPGLEPISIGLERERGGGVVDIFPEMEMIDGAALFGRSA
jgi:hypothetical protein